VGFLKLIIFALLNCLLNADSELLESPKICETPAKTVTNSKFTKPLGI
jgi:hypothetical protein